MTAALSWQLLWVHLECCKTRMERVPFRQHLAHIAIHFSEGSPKTPARYSACSVLLQLRRPTATFFFNRLALTLHSNPAIL